MMRIISAIAPALVFLTSTGLANPAPNPKKIQKMGEVTSTAIFNELSAAEIGAIFLLVDSVDISKELNPAKSSRDLEKVVAKYSRLSRIPWEESRSFFKLCRAKTSTSITLPVGKRDNRWDIFFKYIEEGLPTSEWVVVSERKYLANGSLKHGTAFIYSWPSGNSEILESDSADYPVRVSESVRTPTDQGISIDPKVEFYRRVNPNGTYDLITAIGVPCDQLNYWTVRDNQISIRATLLQDESVREKKSRTSSLKVFRKIPEVAVNPNDFQFPTYFVFEKLRPGTYKVVVEVEGGNNNAGSKEFPAVVLPSATSNRNWISEPVLLWRNVPKGDAVTGVSTHGDTIFPLSDLSFQSGSSIFIRQELAILDTGLYDVEVSLIRKPEITRKWDKKEGEGKDIVGTEEVENENYGDGPSFPFKPPVIPIGEDDSKANEVIFEGQVQFHSHFAALEIPIDLTGVESGEYYLAIWIISGNGVIRISPPPKVIQVSQPL